MVTLSKKKMNTDATIKMMMDNKIALTEDEKNRVEIADFGMSRLDDIGLQLIVYVNTDRCCAKEMVLFPYQTCPEHIHPDVYGEKGKEETFRVRAGVCYLYVAGEPTQNIKGHIPKGREAYYTAMHEIVLQPGEQYTLTDNTLHWFQAGPEGAIISEFSTKSRDECDIFTDPAVERATTFIEG